MHFLGYHIYTAVFTWAVFQGVAAQRSLPIGLALPGETDAAFVDEIRQVLDFRMDGFRNDARLHPSVRNLSFLYDNIPAFGETFAIRSGFNLYNRGAVAVIGTSYSSMTQALSPVMDAYNIPVCDGASTSPRLSDRTMYPNFFRPVPQDNQQAFAVVEFVASQGWSEIAVIASQDSYGQNLANEVSSLALNRSITVVVRENYFTGLSDYSQTISSVRDSLARIIIYCGTYTEFVVMARNAQTAGIYGEGYAWITTDAVKLVSSYSSDDVLFINGAINVFPREGKGDVYAAFLRSWKAADTK
ncbi:hypothetical protein HDU67_000568, partial [Dinochytrium kinnereticum]